MVPTPQPGSSDFYKQIDHNLVESFSNSVRTVSTFINVVTVFLLTIYNISIIDAILGVKHNKPPVVGATVK